MSEFRKESYFTHSSQQALDEALDVKPEALARQRGRQTGMLPQTPKLDPVEVRVPTRRELEDWAEELRGLALRASDLRGAQELEEDIEALEVRISRYL